MQHRYSVAFTAVTSKGERIFESADIELDEPITDSAVKVAIEKDIIKARDLRSCTIIGWGRYENA